MQSIVRSLMAIIAILAFPSCTKDTVVEMKGIAYPANPRDEEIKICTVMPERKFETIAEMMSYDIDQIVKKAQEVGADAIIMLDREKVWVSNPNFGHDGITRFGSGGGGVYIDGRFRALAIKYQEPPPDKKANQKQLPPELLKKLNTPAPPPK